MSNCYTVYQRLYINICVYLYICIYICTYIYIYTHICLLTVSQCPGNKESKQTGEKNTDEVFTFSSGVTKRTGLLKSESYWFASQN